TFGTIPAVIYNGIPTGLRQAIGGPLGDVTDAVPIPSSGHATVLTLRGGVAGAPLTAHRSWVQQFDQVIPQPFCAPGPNAFLYVVGPVTLEQDVEFTSSGHYVSQFRAAGRLNVTPVDPTTGRPSGATYGRSSSKPTGAFSPTRAHRPRSSRDASPCRPVPQPTARSSSPLPSTRAGSPVRRRASAAGHSRAASTMRWRCPARTMSRATTSRTMRATKLYPRDSAVSQRCHSSSSRAAANGSASRPEARARSGS